MKIFSRAMSTKSNVEIKASLSNSKFAHDAAFKMSGNHGSILNQRDVFYITPNGRLKLRTISQDEEDSMKEELIYYERSDEKGPKVSDFIKIEGDPSKGGHSAIHKVLAAACGIRGEVVKKRTLYLVGQTRVHIDEVENLGDFLELEVMLQDGQSPSEGQKIAEDLMEKLGVKEKDLLQGAYMDLLEAKK